MRHGLDVGLGSSLDPSLDLFRSNESWPFNPKLERPGINFKFSKLFFMQNKKPNSPFLLLHVGEHTPPYSPTSKISIKKKKASTSINVIVSKNYYKWVCHPGNFIFSSLIYGYWDSFGFVLIASLSCKWIVGLWLWCLGWEIKRRLLQFIMIFDGWFFTRVAVVRWRMKRQGDESWTEERSDPIKFTTRKLRPSKHGTACVPNELSSSSNVDLGRQLFIY